MKLPSGWFMLAWIILGFVPLSEGILSGDVVRMAFGASMMFGAASLYLTWYVKSENRLKRALEVIFAILVLGVLILGFILTGNFFLGITTLFITVLLFIGFVLSYLLPTIGRIRNKPRQWPFSVSVPAATILVRDVKFL